MTVANPPVPWPQPPAQVEELESATIRFAGDSGDGMQLAGTQFTNTSAILGNDISTLPDFPAEIRAPAGTLAGVSGFQVHFSSSDIHTPGDRLNTLVAMNPAALKTNLKDLEAGRHPDRQLATPSPPATCTRPATRPTRWRTARSRATSCFTVPINKLNRDAVAEIKLSPREADRCKNFFALGLVYWLYERSLEPTLRWIRDKFGKNPAVLEANTPHAQGRLQLRRDHRGACRSTTACAKAADQAGPLPQDHRQRGAGPGPGRRRATLADLPLVYASYPITPASDILHHLAEMKRFGVRTIQAEDEIAAIGIGHRRRVRRRPGRDGHQRPGHLPQVRGHRPGRHDRAAAASSSTCSAAGRAPACRPRPSRPTCCRRCSAATANARSPSSPRARRPTASTWSSRRCAWPSAS